MTMMLSCLVAGDPPPDVDWGCWIEGPCIKEGDTSGGGYMDDYGAEHGGTDKNEDACLARPKDIFDYCENSPSQPVKATFIHTGNSACYPSCGGKFDYGDALGKTILFFEAQRSGKLPSNNRVPGRGDSGMGDRVQGGYYDAGDFVKFLFPAAGAQTILAWAAITFYEGFESAGQVEWIRDNLKWGADFLMGCHTGINEVVVQIGDGFIDHDSWDTPENMHMERPAFTVDASRPGSEPAGEMAAALSATSMFFKKIGESSYADDCLQHAKDLFSFGDQHRGVYSDSVPEVQEFYKSWNGYGDELVWGAAWLAKTTGDASYTAKAEQLWDEMNQGADNAFSWDAKSAGSHIILYEVTGSSKYMDKAKAYLDDATNGKFTPGGMRYASEWGSLHVAQTFAFLSFVMAELGIEATRARDFGAKQTDYMLGDNPSGMSYVVGIGGNFATHTHHRTASCPDPPQACGWDWFNKAEANPRQTQILTGAVVQGPDDQDQFWDSRENYKGNEVSIYGNSVCVGTLSAMSKLHAASPATTTTTTSTTRTTTKTTTTSGPNPTTTTTTDPPNPNCPGGSLAACLAMCPDMNPEIYQHCVQECIAACSAP